MTVSSFQTLPESPEPHGTDCNSSCVPTSDGYGSTERKRLIGEATFVMGQLLNVSDVIVDDDGDIPVRCGDVQVTVCVRSDVPVVQVYSVVLSGLDPPASIYRDLNAMNALSRFIKVLYNDGCVIVCAEVTGEPLADNQLAVVFEAVSLFSQMWASELQGLYGGATAFGRQRPPAATGHAGYL